MVCARPALAGRSGWGAKEPPRLNRKVITQLSSLDRDAWGLFDPSQVAAGRESFSGRWGSGWYPWRGTPAQHWRGHWPKAKNIERKITKKKKNSPQILNRVNCTKSRWERL